MIKINELKRSAWLIFFLLFALLYFVIDYLNLPYGEYRQHGFIHINVLPIS